MYIPYVTVPGKTDHFVVILDFKILDPLKRAIHSMQQ